MYRILVLFMLLWCVNQSALAQSNESQKATTQERFTFETEAQRKAYLNLTAELRCPMCQNQNIADSDAMIAHDMRRKVHQLITQGKTEQEVLDYMKARYGDFVHYQPPVQPSTLALWLLPVLFIVFGAIIVTLVIRRNRLNNDSDIAESMAKADALLNEKDA